MTAPDWATPDVLEKLRFLKDFSFQVTERSGSYGSIQAFWSRCYGVATVTVYVHADHVRGLRTTREEPAAGRYVELSGAMEEPVTQGNSVTHRSF